MAKKFKYEVEIEDKNQFEADLKMDAAITLIKKLSTAMLEKLAYIAKHEPDKIALAKQFLGI